MTEAKLNPALPLIEAVRAIEGSRRRIAVVVSDDGRLLGTLTDGDVRRCLLAGGSLETPVVQAMNTAPVTAAPDSASAHLLDLMRRANVLAVPLVDSNGRFCSIVHLSDVDTDDRVDQGGSAFSFAVIMAGGEGARLRPITESIPKPMVEIGGVPLLERQVRRLAQAGISRVYLSVNYLGHVIERHFGDGHAFGIEIRYLREHQSLGTAGSLGLLPEIPDSPIVVMNGDILTNSNFGSMYAFHESNAASITVAAVDYRVNIPFGVIHSDGAHVTGLAEKPSQRFLCNAGIYVVSPAVLRLLQEGEKVNMTDMINKCLAAGLVVAVFPLHEYWTDIGTPDDLAKARALFAKSERENG